MSTNNKYGKMTGRSSFFSVVTLTPRDPTLLPNSRGQITHLSARGQHCSIAWSPAIPYATIGRHLPSMDRVSAVPAIRAAVNRR